MELKNVLGDGGPADLLTDPRLSTERLEKPIVLFNCHSKGGRAEAAPQTRIGTSDKKTIAEADAPIHNVKQECCESREAVPSALVTGLFPALIRATSESTTRACHTSTSIRNSCRNAIRASRPSMTWTFQTCLVWRTNNSMPQG